MKLLLSLLAFALIWVQPSTGYAATRTVALSVPGMTCAACPITIKKALSRVNGVSDIRVSFEKREATVMFDDTKTTVDVLTQATADAGYPSTAKEVSAK